MNVNQEFVTPAMASALMEANRKNRIFSHGRARAYAASMLRGEWKTNGDVIRIATDGRLLDGQHRLAAIIQSGVGQHFLIVRGLDPSVFDTIDTGAARVASDILSIEGVKNSKVVAAAARMFLTWKATGNPVYGGIEKKPSNSEILEFVKSNESAVRAGEIGGTSGFNKKMISSSIIAFVYLAAVDAGIDGGEVEDFFSRIADPSLGSTEDVTFLLRDRLLQDIGGKVRLRKSDKTALILKAFRTWRAGKKVKNLRVRTEGNTAEKDIFRVI